MVGRKQDAVDRRKPRIAQHLLQIVDEMRAVEHRDALELLSSRALEEHAFDRNGIAVRAEKAVPLHPAQRSRAQIDVGGIEMTVLGLVADDIYLMRLTEATTQELVDAFEHDGIRDAAAVNEALEPLPCALAVGQPSQRVADRLL